MELDINQIFITNGDFQRKPLSRNNHNASKLVEKYNNLAREALANEDKILSESYFQYADHFTRVLSEREKNQSVKKLIILLQIKFKLVLLNKIKVT